MVDDMKQLRDDIVECKSCDLYKTKTLPVIGQGNHDADIMFIGDVPRPNDDLTGVPLSDEPGRVFSEMLFHIGLRREEIYICNTIKCKPIDPEPTEQQTIQCSSFLSRQIELISPKVICCLGIKSAKIVFNLFGIQSDKSMKDIRGIIHKPDDLFIANSKMLGEYNLANINMLVTYHPAAALKNSMFKDIIMEDFETLQSIGW